MVHRFCRVIWIWGVFGRLCMACSEAQPTQAADGAAESSATQFADTQIAAADTAGAEAAGSDTAGAANVDAIVSDTAANEVLAGDAASDGGAAGDGGADAPKVVDSVAETKVDTIADSLPDSKPETVSDVADELIDLIDLSADIAAEAGPDGGQDDSGPVDSNAPDAGMTDAAPDAPADLDVPPSPDSVADAAGDAGVDAAPEVAAPVVRFAALGDAGKANTGQFAVGKALAAYCKTHGCDFVLYLGDNFYDTGVSGPDDPQFETKFVQPYKDVEAPFWVVLGNHDYGGNGSGAELYKGPYYTEYAKKNPKFVHPSNTWDKQVLGVHVFALDSNLQMYGLGDDQVKKFGPLVSNSQATWKIGVAHHPLYSNGPHGNAGTYEGLPGIPIASGEGVKKSVEAVFCNKIDMYLSGHDHTSQWMVQKAGCSMELVVAGAGATTTTIQGQSLLFTPNKTYFEDATNLAFFWVEITGKTLVGRFIDTNGAVLFERKISKL